MVRALYDAFQALLPADMSVHRGYVSGKLTSDDFPYVVLGGGGGDESTEALAGDVDSLELRLRVTYAGLSFDSVLLVMERVRRAFLTNPLRVSGWESGKVRHEIALNIQPDFDVTLTETGLTPLFGVDEFTVFCTR